MRLSTPRIAPLGDDDFNAEQQDVLKAQIERKSVFNIFRTLIKAPKAYRGFMRWGGYVLSQDNSLDAREREIVMG